MIYLVLWVLIGLVSYLAGFKLFKDTRITRKRFILGLLWSLAGPFVTVILLVGVLAERGYLDRLEAWLDEEI